MLEKNVFDFLVNVIGSKSRKIERCYLPGSLWFELWLSGPLKHLLEFEI